MTAQAREILYYKKRKYYMATEPLGMYLKMHKLKSPSTIICTACWRGYLGTWKIKQHKLYLVKITDFDKETKEISLQTFFPEQDEVFADWFTGKIRAPYGEMLNYVHAGYDSVYEKELLFIFEKGELKEFIDQKYVEKDLRSFDL